MIESIFHTRAHKKETGRRPSGVLSASVGTGRCARSAMRQTLFSGMCTPPIPLDSG